MGIDRRVMEAAKAVGRDADIAPEVLIAIAVVETRATPFATIGGRSEPLIRFENHYFDRRLADDDRAKARQEGLSHPRAGRIKNPVSQAARWALFDRASRIDAEAASASFSWGLCQVMGAHGRKLGFGSAAALTKVARGSIEGQLSIGAKFLALGRLADRLMDGDLAGFSRRYNGPGYRRNRYDQKIAAALKRARQALDEVEEPGPIAIGARGAGVIRLQTALRDTGSAIRVDGVFGPRTRAALVAWQIAAGFAGTGVADQATRTALFV